MEAAHGITMRTKSLDEPLYLNLYNFDNVAAKDCPYVLTSPRSLEACRKAGFKPVELLHKSIQDYQEDLGEVTLEEVRHLYAFHERHRLSKLETCRAIRKELMIQTDSTLMKENAPPCNESSQNQKNLESSSRKDQLDKENLLRAAAKQSSRNAVLNHRENTGKSVTSNDSDLFFNDSPSLSPTPQRWYKVLYLTGGGGESSPTSSDSKKKKPSSLPPKPAPITRTKRSSPRTYIYRKSYLNRKNFPVSTAISSLQTGSLSSNSSTTSTSSAIISKSNKKSPSLLREQAGYASLNKPSKTHSKSHPSSANSVKKQIRSSILSWSDSSRKGSLRDYVTSTNYDSNNNSSRESRSSLGNNSFPKRKQVSFSYLSFDDLCLSEHDRRILESMALKKELERESDEFAHQAHILWEQDREEREQLNQEQAAQWREYVAEKRRIENAENTRKWEEMKFSLRKSQLLLEQNINEKEERSVRLRRTVEEKKLSAAGERSQVAAKRRAEIEAAHQQLELETAIWQQSLDQQQKEKLEKAESTRLQHRETYRRRVASANRVEELRHQERWQQVKEETEAALQTLRQLCRVREQRAQDRYQQLLHDRDRQLKGQRTPNSCWTEGSETFQHPHSWLPTRTAQGCIPAGCWQLKAVQRAGLERAIKFQQVRELHDELENGLQKWQEQVLTLQWEATERAEYNAIRQVESKRQRVESENKARQQHHTQLMERICREDEARVRYIRELISLKEAKMKRMAHERDLAIRESRLQAQTTADLREHLRRTLSPETFDRKVARVALEMRIAGRPPTASPTMTRSHIFLG